MKCERKVSLEKGIEEYRFEANANSGRNTIETEHNANEWRKEQCLKERNTLVFQEVKYKHTHRRFNSLPTNTHRVCVCKWKVQWKMSRKRFSYSASVPE